MLLRQSGEQLGAGLRHTRIWLAAARQSRPAAFAHIGALVPRVADGVQLAEIFIGVAGVLEFVDADRRERGDHRLVRLLTRHVGSLATGNPATERKADECESCGSAGRTPED